MFFFSHNFWPIVNCNNLTSYQNKNCLYNSKFPVYFFVLATHKIQALTTLKIANLSFFVIFTIGLNNKNRKAHKLKTATFDTINLLFCYIKKLLSPACLQEYLLQLK